MPERINVVMLGSHLLEVTDVPDGMFQHQLTLRLSKNAVQPFGVSALSSPYACRILEQIDAVSMELGVVEIANACSADHCTCCGTLGQ
jgi:hypothetical protein